MDRVRFGRALGYGARHAARTLAEAAKAAATPSPGQSAGSGTQASTTSPPAAGTPGRLPSLKEATVRLAEAQHSFSKAKGRARSGAAQAGRSMLTPVRRVGGVLWLEMTGSLFTLFALFLAEGLWKLRGAVHAPPSSAEAHKFYLYVVVLLLFTYFAISSFVRAHRRGKRP